VYDAAVAASPFSQALKKPLAASVTSAPPGGPVCTRAWSPAPPPPSSAETML
jgi:hypothetical protein